MTDLASSLDQAEHYVRSGDARAAVSFYQQAMREAQALRAIEPAPLERLRAGQAYIARQMDTFRNALGAIEADLGSEEPAKGERIRHMLEMMDGRRETFLQQPSVLYTPYLANRQFWDPQDFEWAAELEAATPAIRAEVEALLAENAEFRPYIEDQPDRPRKTFHHLNDDPSWSAFYLWRGGELVEGNAERCPATVAALAKVPMSRIGTLTPLALFSRLEAGAHIPPHTGILNCRLICHLPLIVPPGCTLRVGNDTREWQEGKLLIFDDSIEHEAHNPSDERRVILLFDVWRPELSTLEQRALSAVFEAIDNFQAVDED